MGKLGPVQLAYVRGNAWVLVPPPNQEKTTNDVVTYTLGGPSRGFGKALVGGGWCQREIPRAPTALGVPLF